MCIQDDGATVDASKEHEQRAGSFTFRFADDVWQWSPEVERMHGYRPGEVDPTTELLLSHEHPDDQRQVAATLGEIVRTGRPFSARHRIIDAHGRVREVIVVGDGLRGDSGDIVATHGFYIDVTPPSVGVRQDRAHQDCVTEAVAEITENRTAIEQAKGMLMMVYRIDADAAFDLLKWRSQASNVKLRAIAEQIVADFLGLTYSDELPARASYDQLLLTAHERITRRN